MIKPTKTTVRPASPDTSTTNRSNAGNGSGAIPGSSNILAPGTNRLPDTSIPHASGPPTTGAPHVVVSHITDPVINEAKARLAEISLPESQTHLLKPHESADGLFLTPDGQTYAHLEDGRHYRVVLNTAGTYQIPWPEAPGVTPPIVKKIDGQPSWRVEAQWYVAQSRQIDLPAHQQSAELIFVDPNLASYLPDKYASADGIRKGLHGTTYIDIEGGTVQIRRNEQGEYKQVSSTTTNVPDVTLERTPGQFVWRRKLQTSTDTQQAPQPGSSRSLNPSEKPGPSPNKRPRLPGDSDPPDPFVPVRTSELWSSWGSTTKPLVGDSIEFDGKHFAILDQPDHATDALAFIKPPQFSATGFDAFEQLLLTTPELQPRGVVKLADRWTGHGSDTWRVVEGLPFAKSLTQHVSDYFSYLSDHSANKVAREMFNRANYSDEMTGLGAHALFDTFKHWESRNNSSGDNSVIRPDLSDPLMFLSPLATDANGKMYMPLPSTEGLQRIDFDPKLFYGSKHQRNRPDTRTLFRDLLSGHGYQITNDFASNYGNALLIQRRGVDHVFIMFMDGFQNNIVNIIDPKVWLKKNLASVKTSDYAKSLIKEKLRTKRIIFLLGSTETLPTRDYNLVVTRYS
ncbi:hypothetical protein EDF87_103190 [Pseudomonas helmanticensis]|uniref:Uncharacterized protein n=1 Tax=Pseudomonas helmanticensis TaxID=1471381 RepID=A0A4R7VMP1_9PSED|nr:hypothetical protein [Pseudomonas helmanticensis]TDV50558.1 hypothetical protein EDF87_103190 [Pseudomonas helmanticensis]